jgi:hypothetical protein
VQHRELPEGGVQLGRWQRDVVVEVAPLEPDLAAFGRADGRRPDQQQVVKVNGLGPLSSARAGVPAGDPSKAALMTANRTCGAISRAPLLTRSWTLLRAGSVNILPAASSWNSTSSEPWCSSRASQVAASMMKCSSVADLSSGSSSASVSGRPSTSALVR